MATTQDSQFALTSPDEAMLREATRPTTKSAIMKRGWAIAKQRAECLGGKAREYIADGLHAAWVESGLMMVKKPVAKKTKKSITPRWARARAADRSATQNITW